MDREAGDAMWRRAFISMAANAMAVLAIVSSAAIPTGTALAASPGWTIQHSPNVTLPGGQIRSMSCPSATSCVAVGSFVNASGITDTLAEAWNGTSWRRQTTPNPASDTVPAVSPALAGVSCPVAGFCEAVGAYSTPGTNASVILAESWNGTSWTIRPVPYPSGSSSAVLSSVSCTSPTFCEAAGFAFNSFGAQTALAETWNGAAWSVQSVPVPAGATFTSLGSVSCASATFCEVMGASPAFADMWNGISWTLQATSGGGGLVSCVSPSFCMAVNGTGATGSAIWNGSAWAPQPLQGPSGAIYSSFGALSCSSAQACEVVGYFSDNVSTTAGPSLAEAWNGTSWTVQPTPNPAGSAYITSLNAVSCVSAAFCEAGGYFGNISPDLEAVAEGWNGDSWVLQAAATPRGATSNALNGVSCVRAAFCEAVGTATDNSANVISLAEGWNGTSWQIQPTPVPAQSSNGVRATMSGVSCVSASFCEAVGFSAAGPGPAAWQWDGTSWTAQPVPGTRGPGSVACTSATFCMGVANDGETDSWNGSAWSQSAAIPSFTATSVSCVSATSCEAVGSDPTGTQQAAAWNGTAWSLQATPMPADGSSIGLTAVSCVAADDCTAAGSYFQNPTFNQVTLAEHWNGSAWAVQATPTPTGSTVNLLLGIWCRSANFCAAVGEQQNSSTLATLTLVQVWNGTSWTTRTSPNRTVNDLDVLNSVWCGAGNSCTAVGIGADRGEVNATLVETGS
jgi:hypothetical protein